MDRLCELPTLTEAKLRHLFREMINGVKACHQLNIVHRDIKLDNFLFGGLNYETVKLADFGLAAKMPKKGKMRSITGTAPYMSPEMLAGEGYDTKTDVWSYAVTLYSILYGECVYTPKEPTPAAIKKAIKDADPPPTFQRPPKIAQKHNQPPHRAEQFCRDLLKRNPDERPTVDVVLQHPFLDQKATESEDLLVETAAEQARHLDELLNRRGLSMQRSLDEFVTGLARSGSCLQAQSSNRKSPTGSDYQDDDNWRTAASPAEHRRPIRTSGRRFTHSGVIRENSNELYSFDLLPGPDSRAEISVQLDMPDGSSRPDGCSSLSVMAESRLNGTLK
eukprot:CAMPEP_0197628288 /NCGR_PEP_ID=MMETSP1338-20131121/6652_1 /TAXON_ID=43686 ORGANISM="Pelagodinium beii, Strain RCC1491" /NCGR_SAMPLE_ID=MMETSP1338 /ASSEMBLY_ACC=CAM_ASM_000754 /LENGTH=333 /DNA_ID=CAMNT_0043199239 /DNA_START=93 /DNA_END=1094 /DNA_ORIENTATION=-